MTSYKVYKKDGTFWGYIVDWNISSARKEAKSTLGSAYGWVEEG